jgi:hypothetical protein
MSMSSANEIRLSQEIVGFIVVGRKGRVRVDEIMCVTVPLSNYLDISHQLRVQCFNKRTSMLVGAWSRGNCNSKLN